MIPSHPLITLILIPYMLIYQEFQADRELTDLTITSWTTDEGLISNSTTGVVQTPDGYLWISSYNGVSRFDGSRFQLFSTTNTDVFRTNAVINMHVDSKGILWLATQGSGILMYDAGFEKIDNIPNSTRFVTTRENGEVWAGTNENGLYQIKDGEGFRVYPEIIDGTVNGIAFDQSGNLWVGTDANGLIRISPEAEVKIFTVREGLSSNSIYSLAVYDNLIYVGTAAGLNVFNEGRITNVPALNGIGVNTITAHTNNALWFGTEAGLSRLDHETGKLETLTEKAGFPGRQISSLCFDKEGSLWVTTDKNGLIQLQSSQISNITTGDGLSSDDVNIVTGYGNNKTLIGLDNGDIYVYDGSNMEKLSLTTNMNSLGIRDIYVENEDKIWIASYNGLLYKVGDEEVLYSDKNLLPDRRIRRIIGDNGALWLATRGGLFKFADERIEKVFNKNNGLGSNYIMAIEKAENGNLIIGTKDGGLNILTPNDSISIFYPGDTPEGWLIFNVEMDSEGHIWCATNTGLYIFREGEFRNISADAGLPIDTYFDIIKDNDGNTWLTSHLGLFRFSDEALLNYVNGESEILYYDQYDESDGMNNRECTAATPSFIDSDGTLYFPTFGGVALVDPRTLETNTYVPPVHISGAISNYERLDYGESLVFNPGPNQFEIQYASLSYSSPEKNRFQYRMKGFEDNWITTSESTVHYSNLPHGEYTFEVKGSNNHGIWNEEPATLKVIVLPNFYQTTGFYLVVVTLTLVVLILIYYWRITVVEKRNKELKKLNAELDSFVYSTSHDLRAPLASIQGLINIAKIEGSIEKKDHYMDLMNQSVLKLDLFIRDIINYSRNSRLDISRDKIEFRELIEEIFSVLHYLDKDDHVEREININQTDTFYSDRRRIFIILNNLISNAFQYQKQNGEAKKINVDINANASNVTIRVADNGVGIPKDSQKRVFHMFYRASNKSAGSGLGLYIVKETINKLNGTISVDSEEDVGTEFEIKIPNSI